MSAPLVSTSAAIRALLVLALPMMMTRATQSVMTFADALLVEHLGPGAIAASATGGMNTYALIILPMGTVFIVQSFVAQLVGRGERDSTARFAWYGLIIAAIAGVVALAAIPAVGPVLGLTGYSAGVRDEMTTYMHIRLTSVAAVVAVEALGNWYGGLGNTKIAMVASIVQMIVDLALNIILIFGYLGFPAMGVAGAALSTAIASWVGCGVLLIAFWRRWGGAPPRPARLGLSLQELWRVARFGLPNGLNYFLEFAAFQIFVNVMLAGLGDVPVAAMNVVMAINSISFMPAFGLASAGAILAGQAIGAGQKDAVGRIVRLTLLCTMTWMGVIGALYFVAPEALLGLFDSHGSGGNLDPTAPPFGGASARGPAASLVAIGVSMLAISAAWQLFDAVGMTLGETLRAAGDTTWPMAMRILLAWVVFIPSSYLVVEVWGGGAIGAMVCVVGYIGLLGLLLAYRFRSGKWKSIELIEPKLV